MGRALAVVAAEDGVDDAAVVAEARNFALSAEFSRRGEPVVEDAGTSVDYLEGVEEDASRALGGVVAVLVAEGAVEVGGEGGVVGRRGLPFDEPLVASAMSTVGKDWGDGVVVCLAAVLVAGAGEGGVGVVTDKNYNTYASADVKAAVDAAIAGILDGSIVVDSALTEAGAAKVAELREAVRP